MSGLRRGALKSERAESSDWPLSLLHEPLSSMNGSRVWNLIRVGCQKSSAQKGVWEVAG